MKQVNTTASSSRSRGRILPSVLLVMFFSLSMANTHAFAGEIQSTSQFDSSSASSLRSVPFDEVLSAENDEDTLFATEQDTAYTVEYYFNGVKDGYLTVHGQGAVGSAIPYEAFPQIGHKGSNFVLESVDGANKTISGVASDNIVRIMYASDNLGTDPTNPDSPDNVPDKYQAVVTFSAVNGVVSSSKAVVTLYNEAGQWSENGSGHLSNAQIPNARAGTGFSQDTVAWIPQKPTSSISIYRGGTHFEARFSLASDSSGGETAPGTPTIIPDEPVETIVYSSLPAALVDNAAVYVSESVERLVGSLVGGVATPLAEWQLFGSANPLSAYSTKGFCWVHWALVSGLIIMVIYTVFVLVHRRRFIHELDTFKKEIIAKPQEELAEDIDGEDIV